MANFSCSRTLTTIVLYKTGRLYHCYAVLTAQS